MRSAAARSQINGLAVLKCTPKALTWGIFARVDRVLHDDLDRQNEPGDDGQCRNKRLQIGAQDRRQGSARTSGRCFIRSPMMPPGANITTAMKNRRNKAAKLW